MIDFKPQGTLLFSLNIRGVGKYRTTRNSFWTPAAKRYVAWKEEVRRQADGFRFPPHGAHVVFRFAMPKSYSRKERAELLGQPFQQKPDADNSIGSLMDALEAEDSHIWDLRVAR